MRPSSICSLLSFFLVSGCATAPPPVRPTEERRTQPARAPVAPRAPFSIDPAERGIWVLRVTRELGGFGAEGVILLASDITPPPDTPHVALAGSRAFLLLGEGRLRAGDLSQAIAAANAGIAELGRNYAKPLVLDDTSLSIALAEEYVAKGRLEFAARRLLSVLRSRTGMYVRKHAPHVRLPPEGPSQEDEPGAPNLH